LQYVFLARALSKNSCVISSGVEHSMVLVAQPFARSEEHKIMLE
jgi:hypothetical protein